MYKLTITKKDSYSELKLRYERFVDASITMENILAGDTKCEIEVKIEIENEEGGES